MALTGSLPVGRADMPAIGKPSGGGTAKRAGWRVHLKPIVEGNENVHPLAGCPRILGVLAEKPTLGEEGGQGDHSPQSLQDS